MDIYPEIKIIKTIQFIAIGFILENYSKIKGIVSISKGYTYPYISTFWVFKPDCITSRAIICFYYCLFIIWWHLCLSKYFFMFIDENYLKYSIVLGDFDSTFPNHVLPIIKVVTLGWGQGWYLKYGDSFGFVAKD